MESDILITFAFEPSIGFLEIENMELSWLNNISQNNKIFKRLNPNDGFDYYFFNNILIIPDPIPSPRLNWNKTISIKDKLEIDCKGKYISFFHFEKNDNIIFAKSLTLPEYIFLKDNINIK